jgi:hypothetical protein
MFCMELEPSSKREQQRISQTHRMRVPLQSCLRSERSVLRRSFRSWPPTGLHRGVVPVPAENCRASRNADICQLRFVVLRNRQLPFNSCRYVRQGSEPCVLLDCPDCLRNSIWDVGCTLQLGLWTPVERGYRSGARNCRDCPLSRRAQKTPLEQAQRKRHGTGR